MINYFHIRTHTRHTQYTSGERGVVCSDTRGSTSYTYIPVTPLIAFTEVTLSVFKPYSIFSNWVEVYIFKENTAFTNSIKNLILYAITNIITCVFCILWNWHCT